MDAPGEDLRNQLAALRARVQELEAAEQALRESELRFRQVAETIRQVFYITSADHRVIHYVSPAYEEVWGRTCASLYDNPLSWVESIHPEDRGRVLEGLPTGQGHGEYWFEYRMVRPDGAVRWISDRAFELRDETGAPYRIVGVADDITERRRLEEQLREAQRMEAIGQLARGVAHDFNNLLTVVLANASLVRGTMSHQDTNQLRLQELEEAARRAAELVQKLLGFTRDSTPSLQDVDLRTVLEDSGMLLRAALGASIEVEIQTPESPAVVLADRSELGRVLLNLSVNARDAMPLGGRLVLALRERSIGPAEVGVHLSRREGAFVCLSVEDTGTGISAEILPRIFEPFFTTKEPGYGSGLGLALVFGIVRLHGGWIECASQVGRGTRFEIFLPRPAGGVAPTG